MKRAALVLFLAVAAGAASAGDIRENKAVYLGAEGSYYKYDNTQQYYNNWVNPVNIRYGVDRRYVTYAGLRAEQWIYCTATEFGIDPAPGVAKHCWRVNPADETSTPPPPPSNPSDEPFSATPAPVPPTGTGPGLLVAGTCFRNSDDALRAAMGSGLGVSWQGPTSTDTGSVTDTEIRYIVRYNGQDGTDSKGIRLPIVRCEPQDLKSYMPQVSTWFAALLGLLCLRMVYSQIFKKESY